MVFLVGLMFGPIGLGILYMALVFITGNIDPSGRCCFLEYGLLGTMFWAAIV